VPLERENYNLDVLEDYDAVVNDLKSKNPSGRLAIFDGVPGTGKTYMIRGLLSEVPDALFVLVPANLIQELSNPGMINALLETRRNKGDHATVFIVEDADDCLGSRDSTNVNAVSALLNLGDGIIGALMDIRLVCTTNLKNDELDEAVTRPGRLSRKIHVGPLDRKIAEALYEKLTGKKVKIDEKLTLAQVYSLAREDGWKPVQKKRAIGFGASDVSPALAHELKQLGIDPDEE
jgi:ATP-dependent 26S proteasome regulatory subunit